MECNTQHNCAEHAIHDSHYRTEGIFVAVKRSHKGGYENDGEKSEYDPHKPNSLKILLEGKEDSELFRCEVFVIGGIETHSTNKPVERSPWKSERFDFNFFLVTIGLYPAMHYWWKLSICFGDGRN